MNRKYRKTVIAGNWKMNKTPSETKEFMTAFKAMMPKGRWCDVALCVPAVCIPAAVRRRRFIQRLLYYLSCRQAMPGSSRPSRNSREAPPPVEMWVIWEAKPSCSQAAALSPPPTMVTASLSARA